MSLEEWYEQVPRGVGVTATDTVGGKGEFENCLALFHTVSSMSMPTL